MAQEVNTSEMLSMKGHIVKSSFNGKSYQLYVSLPVEYNSSENKRYPVLYLLDAYYSYPIVCSLHKLLDQGGEIEKIIIISIGDKDQSNKEWLISRTLDYTPSNDPAANSDIAGMINLDATKVKSGGAKSFLETIRKDIIPFVDNHYQTTNDNGIAGHSLGGLFAGYCLFTAPDVFTRYGISSPSFLWNNDEILSTEKAFAAKHMTLNAKVFISVGSLEPKVMFPPIDAFTKALKEHNYKGLSLTHEIFENETHSSVMAASITRTLKILYPKQ